MTQDDHGDAVNPDTAALEDEWTSADEPVDLQKSAPATERLAVPGTADAPAGGDLWPEDHAPTPDPGTAPITAPRPAATPTVSATGREPGKVRRSSPGKAKRSTKKMAVIGTAAVLLVGLVGLGGTELYLRHQATDCLSKAFGSLTGAPTDVSLSARPMLWQAMTKEIPFVDVKSADSADGDGRLNLRVEDIRSSGDQSTIRSIKGEGHVPFDQVTSSAQDRPGGLNPSGAQPGKVESIKSNGDGTIDVTSTVTAVIIPLPVTVTLRPHIKDGKAHFEVVRASMLAFGIPPDFAQTVVDETTEAMFGSMLRNLTLSKLEVVGDGVDFAVNGSDVTVSENLFRPRGDCREITTTA